jgi:hypothetical protein
MFWLARDAENMFVFFTTDDVDEELVITQVIRALAAEARASVPAPRTELVPIDVAALPRQSKVEQSENWVDMPSLYRELHGLSDAADGGDS